MGDTYGTYHVSGLATGLDADTIISQLMALRRQPITRLEQRIDALEGQQEAIRDIRTRLLTLFNRSQDFTLNMVFDQYAASSSDTDKLTSQISGSNVAEGSYKVEILQLASATVARSDNFISKLDNTSATLENAGFSTTPTSGYFTVNGVQITVDVTVDTIDDIMTRITSSAAGVTAMFDDVTEKVVLMNTDPSSTDIILLGSEDDTSNFLDLAHLPGANQSGTPTTVQSTTNLGVLNPSSNLSEISFEGGTVSAGTFKINGVEITIDDPTTTSLSDVIGDINSSDAGVLSMLLPTRYV